MKVLLVNNRYKESTELMAQNIAERLSKKNIIVEIDDGSNEVKNIDLIIVLGGDGTILRAARQYAYKNIPILGVNMGTIGFLSSVEVNEFYHYLGLIIQGDYSLDERMMLEASIYQNNQLIQESICLNEVVVKSKNHQMISLNLEIGGDKQAIYRGDGLLVATPTGSTAYSLSCGGPIVDPDLDSFIITPLAPHLITQRPLVLSPTKEILISNFTTKHILISLDGQINLDIEDNCMVKIIKSEHRILLVDLKKHPFFSRLDVKLGRNGV